LLTFELGAKQIMPEILTEEGMRGHARQDV
jgi:hypothetical protein